MPQSVLNTTFFVIYCPIFILFQDIMYHKNYLLGRIWLAGCQFDTPDLHIQIIIIKQSIFHAYCNTYTVNLKGAFFYKISLKFVSDKISIKVIKKTEIDKNMCWEKLRIMKTGFQPFFTTHKLFLYNYLFNSQQHRWN